MDDQRFGAAIRALRLRRGWRQEDLAARASTSRATVSRLERGHLAEVTISLVRGIAGALDARASLELAWRGGQLGRLLDERHAALQDLVAGRLSRTPGWRVEPEVTFSVYGERGAIDLLGWHEARRALLVIEIKSELLDLQDLLSVLDRKRRLAPVIVRERGWRPASVGAWVVLGEGHGNRLRVAAHRELLRSALPAGGVAMRRWLASPAGSIGGLSFVTIARPGNAGRPVPPLRRARSRGRC